MLILGLPQLGGMVPGLGGPAMGSPFGLAFADNGEDGDENAGSDASNDGQSVPAPAPPVAPPANIPSSSSPGIPDTVDAFKSMTCQAGPTGTVCTPTDAPASLMYMNLQDAIEKAARQLEILHQPLSPDGKIGPNTAGLAQLVLLNGRTPQTSRVKMWLNDARTSNPDQLVMILARQPKFSIDTFDEISGFVRPAIFDPRSQGPQITIQVPPATVPATSAPAQTFWQRRKKVIVTVGVSAVVFGALAYILRPRSGRFRQSSNPTY